MKLETLVGCLIIKDDKTLLVKEDGEWKIPSKEVSFLENKDSVASEVAKEKAGVLVKVKDYLGAYTFYPSGKRCTLHVYRAEMTSKIIKGEKEARFQPIDYLNSPATPAPNRMIYEDIVKKGLAKRK